MKSEELRSIQAPLKAKYRSHPEAALVTLRAVSIAMGLNIGDAGVKAEGDLDFRGTLGVSGDAPVGFRSIRLSFVIDSDASETELQTLLRLTERYCVVYQTLLAATDVKAGIVKVGTK